MEKCHNFRVHSGKRDHVTTLVGVHGSAIILAKPVSIEDGKRVELGENVFVQSRHLQVVVGFAGYPRDGGNAAWWKAVLGVIRVGVHLVALLRGEKCVVGWREGRTIEDGGNGLMGWEDDGSYSGVVVTG